MFSIYHDIEILSDEIRIFEAISSPEGLNNWWTRSSNGKPEIGSIYNYYFNEEYDWYAKVIEVEISKKISLQMTIAAKDWVGTTLHFKILEISDSKSLLRFEHKGWKAPTDHFRRSSYCWALYLTCLKNYIEKGTIKEYETRTQLS